MKPQYFLTFFALAAVALLVDCNCKKPDPDPDKRIAFLNSIKGKWKVANVNDVKFEGVGQQTYNSFTLTIEGTDDQAIDKFDYKAEGRPTSSPWNKAGKFSFVSGSEDSKVLRDDNTTIDYVLSVGTTTTLKLNFIYSGDAYAGRVAEVKGKWEFLLTKQ